MPFASAEPDSFPSGTVTFLFTDIEGSTRLLQRLGDAYVEVLNQHHAILADAVDGARGRRVGTEGDALFAVFPGAADAVDAAVAAQRGLAAHDWPGGESVRVRMGLHTGEGRLSTTNYVGLDVHRASRIASSGHGGQVVLSQATQALVQRSLPDGVRLLDLGEHSLKDLEHAEHLFQLVIPGLPAKFPPLRSLGSRPNNLPALLTTFVGRDREVAAIKDMVESTRLVTLTGPGGTGKTRLSMEAAMYLLPDFADGVFFVRLAEIRDPALIPSSIAQAIGIQEALDRPMLDAVRDYLRDRHILLVLDNFEQIIAGAPLVADLLEAASKLRVLATSREILHLSGEQEYPVPPLDLPNPHALPDVETLSRFDALALFVQRARTVDPAFALTDQNATAVAEICARLDGLPLAIELATARLKLLSPEAILRRLERRLPLLTGGARNLPERQRTLQSTIAWSYDLLNPAEQRLFRRLGVFLGGWQLPAAEAIAGEEMPFNILDGMASLVDKSLVRQSTDDGAEPRFGMLETIREYAADKLEESGERESVARRHAETFLALAEEAEPHLTASDQQEWLDGLQREMDNMRTALAWTVEQRRPDMGLRIGAAVWRFWHFRGHLEEGRMQLERLLALPEASERTPARARGLNAMASILYWQSDYARAQAMYEEALAVFREVEDRPGMADALHSMGYLSMIEGDHERAERYLDQSRGLARESGDRRLEAYTGLGLAHASHLGGRLEQTLAMVVESLPILEELGETWGVANLLGVQGRVLIRLRRLDEARGPLRRCVEILRDAGDVPGIAWAIDDVASLELAGGHPERAIQLSGAAEAFREALGAGAPTALTEHEDPRPKVRGRMDEEEIDRNWSRGKAMTEDEAVAFALETLAAPAPDPGSG